MRCFTFSVFLQSWLQDFHPLDGNRFMSSGMDNTVKIWTLDGEAFLAARWCMARAAGRLQASGLTQEALLEA